MFCIYSRRLADMGECEDLFETEDELGDYFGKRTRELLDMTDLALGYARQYSRAAGYLAKALMELGAILDDIAGGFTFSMAEDTNESVFQMLFDKVKELYDEAERQIMSSDLSIQEKERFLSKLRDFYGDVDFCNMKRFDYCADTEKAYYYQELIDGLEAPDPEVIDISRMDYDALARMAEEQKEYDKAVSYYEKALEEGTRGYDHCLSSMAYIYKKQRKNSLAIECYQRILDLDKKHISDGNEYTWYTASACRELIALLLKKNKAEAAKQYARELIYFEKEAWKKNQSDYSATGVIFGYYTLYLLESEEAERESYWKAAVEYFHKLQEEEISAELIEFLVEYIRKQEGKARQLELIFHFLKRIQSYRGEEEQLMLCGYELCGTGKELVRERIEILLRLGETMQNQFPARPGLALKYCKEAFSLWQQYIPEDEYIRSLVYNGLAESYFARRNHNYDKLKKLRKECNYYLIAERKGEVEDIKKKAELWEWASREYSYADNETMKIRCLERRVELLERDRNTDYESFRTYWWEVCQLLQDYVWVGEKERVLRPAEKVYQQMLDFFYSAELSEYQWESLYTNIRELSEVCQEAGEEEAAVRFYAAALLTAVEERPEKQVLEEALYPQPKLLLSKLYTAMEKDAAPEQVDRVAEIYDKIRPVCGRKQRYEELRGKLEWFAKQYQLKELEFKREEET